MSTAVEWGCEKWADCLCAKTGQPCGCGTGCACGKVSVEDVTKAMETQCPKADCSCGDVCKCAKDSCTGGGTVDKTREQWVEYVAAQSAADAGGH